MTQLRRMTRRLASAALPLSLDCSRAGARPR